VSAPQTSYRGMTDRQISETWQRRFLGEYSQTEMERIDLRWRSLGKKAAHGAAVRLEPRRRRGSR
jgi:hypothetical protein